MDHNKRKKYFLSANSFLFYKFIILIYIYIRSRLPKCNGNVFLEGSYHGIQQGFQYGSCH